MVSVIQSRVLIGSVVLLALVIVGQGFAGPVPAVRPVAATEPVDTDAEDPAIWVNSRNPASSLIIGTDKGDDTHLGGLYVYGLDGRTRQVIRGLARPNNVDVEYGFKFGGRSIDIAVLTERHRGCIRVYAISSDGKLSDISAKGLPVFVGEKGDFAAPMGIGLYKRPRDGAVFAILSRKSGPRTGYLWQYRLRDDGKGRVMARLERKFGAFSGRKEIESVAVDDALGIVYYGDETCGIRKYHADPDRKGCDRELAHFARTGFSGDHEGIAIYPRSGGGWVICTDQVPRTAGIVVYRRTTDGKLPCTDSKPAAVLTGGADDTDGIEVTSRALGKRFPKGIFVAMNSSGRNFLIYSWDDIARMSAPE